jgi:cell surface protein SprA
MNKSSFLSLALGVITLTTVALAKTPKYVAAFRKTTNLAQTNTEKVGNALKKPKKTVEKPVLADFSANQTDLSYALDTLPNPATDRPTLNGNTRPPTAPPAIDLKDPAAVKTETTYDPVTGTYKTVKRIGYGVLDAPPAMTMTEYLKAKAEQQKREYFGQLARSVDAASVKGKGIADPLRNIDMKSQLLDRLFGGSDVHINPQGNIDVTLGGNYQRQDNPNLTLIQREFSNFDFDMGIQLNVVGTIGTKLKLSANYNTKSTFDFENQVKLTYGGQDLNGLASQAQGAVSNAQNAINNAKNDPLAAAQAAGVPMKSEDGTEDQIFQGIEAGNVSLPLRSNLIQGSQTLFGIKTRWKFGHLMVTNIVSQQKSKRQELAIQGGSQLQNFSIEGSRYDENRHFFVSHYNRDKYEDALKNMPQVNSLFHLTKVELWVTNTRNATEGGVRDIVALSDLGEPERITNGLAVGISGPGVQRSFDLGRRPLPKDSANNLKYKIVQSRARTIDEAVTKLQMEGLQQTTDFEKVRARKLAATEYTFHADLGYVSLNTTLQPTDVLGIAYEYTYNGKVFRVGELSGDVAVNADSLNVLYVKMLKATTASVRRPVWDLMMKNVYSLGAYQINPQDFKLNVIYQDALGGERTYIPKVGYVPGKDGPRSAGEPLLRVLNLDNLNSQRDPIPDGMFDFVPGVTINPTNGRVYFPVLQPFGTSLSREFSDPAQIPEFAYQQLYDSTVTRAINDFSKLNRFLIKGSYKSSSSSDISLGAFNIPKNSVKVNAGGQQLVEGRDFEVDYNIGRIKILNESVMNSGLPIKVSFEDNSLFSFNVRNMIGTRLDYVLSDEFSIGATHIRLNEQPFTQKVNLGDDPIDNNIIGLDFRYTKEAPWLTKALDALPFYSTKAPSRIALGGEVAHLIPGHSPIIDQTDKGGSIYLDDFEGSISNYDLRLPANAWNICATPRTDVQSIGRPNHPYFPEADSNNAVVYGMNRARLNWYRMDPTKYDNSNPYSAKIEEKDVFRQVDLSFSQNPINFSFDLSYYPRRRGPYNYDGLPVPGITAGAVPATGELLEPKTRWAGIQRPIQNADFEATNIEFVEFWMMSPFLGDASTNPGGDLYLNLGNVSEDILRDSRMFFEHGLPSANSNIRVDETKWGKIPRAQPITNAFDNNPDVRILQDVGFDGLNDAEETAKFAAYLAPFGQNADIRKDPSSDNFKFFNDPSYETAGTPIRERYLFNNNPQGNSPSNLNSDIAASSTNLPDLEDLNRDNSLNETESYYEYKIPIRPLAGSNIGEIQPNAFIVDTVRTIIGRDEQNPLGQAVIFYQFKVPIQKYTTNIGGIQDFRSIRYIRMYMHDWEQQATLRMPRLQLVRNQWRRYTQTLLDPRVGTPPSDEDPTSFNVVSVNYEQNSQRRPYPYVLPPGITRTLAINPTQQTQQNEQALELSVCNLQDGDSRGITKLFNLDMRTFKRLKMFVHAEKQELNDPFIKDKDMSIFMRIGSDFEKNYYEYEIPLTFTKGVLAPESADLAQKIWLEDNTFDFAFDLLRKAKTDRNAKIQRGEAGVSVTTLYEINDPDKPNNKIRIKGNPDLGYARGVMIGVRNPINLDDYGGVSHCATVWVNELRANGFDERGGTAAQARMDVTLADLGTFTASGNYSSIGWGSLEQRVAQRAKEELLQYDVATTIEMGKFLPKNSGIRLPFFAQYSKTIKTPQFDPFQLDIPFDDALKASANPDSLRSIALTTTTIRGYNFTNVRKDRTNAKTAPMPWDIENVSLTYAYNQTQKTDPTIQVNVLDQYRGSIDYSYSVQKPLEVKPFKWLPEAKGWTALVRDLNFNLLPNTFTFSNQMNRQVGEIRYRASAVGENELPSWFDKRFTWDRSYNLQWNLTKSIGFTYSAVNNAFVDEPRGQLDTPEKQEILWSNVKQFGRNRNYTQNMALTYTVPINKIPLLDWVQIKAQYAATYGWAAANLNTDSLGNVVQNTQNRQLNADLDFTKLYNKWSYFKAINTAPKRSANADKKGKKGKDGKTAKIGKDGKPLPEDETEEKDGKDTDPDVRGVAKGKTAKPKQKGGYEPTTIERVFLRPLMMVRKGRATFQEQFGTSLPGFMPKNKLLGLSNDWQAPGWEFVTGAQPNSRWLDRAAERGWISDNIYLNQQVQQTYTQTINGQITVEPFDEFRIDVTANKTFSRNHSELFKFNYDDDTLRTTGKFGHLTPMDMGNMTVSFFTLNTLFIDKTGDDYSKIFKNFETNRLIISERIGEGAHQDGRQDSLGYKNGYGRYAQGVLVPAFVSAYTGANAATTELDIFKTLPLPNWKLTYNGLTKIPVFGKIFASFSLTHGYKSTMNVNTYRTNLQQNVNENGQATNIDPISRNFYSIYEIPDIVIQEQLQPLIGVDFRLKNDLNLRFDYKKSRTITMNFTDYQINETRTDEFTVGAGYRIKGLRLPFTIGPKKAAGKKKDPLLEGMISDPDGKDKDKKGKKGKKTPTGTVLDNDLNFKFDLSYRDDITFNRPLDQDPVRTRGLRTLRIAPSIDYQLNKNLNVRLFYDYSQTTPATSASFPITNAQGGMTIRFSLGR